MDKATRSKAFEPFFTSKGPAEGTGLGLASVCGIVKQNQGYIEVQSEVGRGTTFSLFFPRHEGEAPDRHERRYMWHVPGGHASILVVDDEPEVLKSSCGILEGLGYQVTAAGAPAEALERAALRQEPIDLLLTDVVMPHMSGSALARHLLDRWPELKCVFMSGYAPPEDSLPGEPYLSAHFIQKPFVRRDLALKLSEILGPPRSEARLS